MRKRLVSIQTVLDPYGLVRISGEVARDTEFDPITEGCTGSPFDVYDLIVSDSDGHHIQDEMDAIEIEKCSDVLIEKYIDDEQSALDYMVDEAIERGKEYKHLAYA